MEVILPWWTWHNASFNPIAKTEEQKMKRSMLITTCILLVLGVVSATAQPPGKGNPFRQLKPLRTVADFESVKKGDKLGVVCLQCHVLSEMEIEDGKNAMAYCTEGTEVTCPACKKTYKTVLHGPPGKRHKQRYVTYFNEEGMQCAFMSGLRLKQGDKKGDE